MKKYVSINNINFEVNKKLVKEFKEYKNLDNCYSSYSTHKAIAYDYWRRVFENIDNDYYLTISSYNANVFTLYVEFKYQEKNYVAYITKAHNYINEI